MRTMGPMTTLAASMVKVACVAAVVLLSIVACTSNTAPQSNSALVIDKTFDIKSADPHRELSVTGAMLAKALYSTLLTFDGADESTPVPLIARSYSSSDDARRFTFELRRDVVFSDGTPLTAADVVFSVDRVINLKAAPAALLAGVSVSAPDAYTVSIASLDPNPALPSITTNPSLAILNSRVVQGHGGVAAAGADKTDKATDFLNSTSAGSGPYVLESFSTSSNIVLTANPRYWRAKPFYSRVVIANTDAAAQLGSIRSTAREIALDLTPAQAGTLNKDRSVRISATPGAEIVFLFANDNPLVSAVTSNRHFQSSIRSALDYGAIVQLMGTGATRSAGLVPSMLLGALPSWAAPRTDLVRASSELDASGFKSPTVTLGFASDALVDGLAVSALASMVRAELGSAGINVNLAGSPSASATSGYAAGSEQLGLWVLAPGYADPNYYLAFLPGHALGLSAGWPAGADPSLESLGIQATTTADPATRAQLFQHLQGQLNDEGPFFPLVQPGRVIVAATGIAAIDYNPSWSVDIASVSG
jgi:peptide/nickel transport system substrate-binding protein